MGRDDPRLKRLERLLANAAKLLDEIRSSPPPRKRRRRPRRKPFRRAAVLAALRDGARLGNAYEERDPRLPDRHTITRYRLSDKQFDRDIREILKARSASVPIQRVVVRGATVWAKHLPGPGYDWDAIATKIEAGATIGPNSPNRQGLPSHTLIMARRRADPVFAARVAAVVVHRIAAAKRIRIDREHVLQRVRDGAVIKAWPPEPGMPAKALIDRERHEDPKFDTAMRAAIVEARRRRSNRVGLSKLDRAAPWTIADKTVPRTLASDIREDVVGDLALAIRTGQVGLQDDLQAAWKRCRTQLTGHRWKEQSLDAPIAGFDGLRRIDLLAADVESA